MLEISLKMIFRLLGLTVENNLHLMNCIKHLVLFIKHLVLKLLNRMLLLRKNINTFLMLLTVCYFNSDFLRLIGHMLLLKRFI